MRTKSVIYTPKRDVEHLWPLHNNPVPREKALGTRLSSQVECPLGQNHRRVPEYYIASVQNRCSWNAYPCTSFVDLAASWKVRDELWRMSDYGVWCWPNQTRWRLFIWKQTVQLHSAVSNRLFVFLIRNFAGKPEVVAFPKSKPFNRKFLKFCFLDSV